MFLLSQVIVDFAVQHDVADQCHEKFIEQRVDCDRCHTHNGVYDGNHLVDAEGREDLRRYRRRRCVVPVWLYEAGNSILQYR